MKDENLLAIVDDSLTSMDKKAEAEVRAKEELEAKIRASKLNEEAKLKKAEQEAILKSKKQTTEEKLDKYFQRYDTGELSQEDFTDHILALVYKNRDTWVMEHNIKMAIENATERVERNIIANEDSAYDATLKSLGNLSDSLHEQIISSKNEIASQVHTNGRKIDNIKSSRTLR